MKSRWALSPAVLLLATAPILFAQNLAEAAKKERERRAAYKNKSILLITNDALSRLSKNPAVSNTATETATAADFEAAPARDVPTATVTQKTDKAGRDPSASDQGQVSGAESSWQKAKEYADLLELKLNALWLQFYSMNDGMPRELLQQEISATFEKYTRAREEENKLRGEAGPQKARRD